MFKRWSKCKDRDLEHTKMCIPADPRSRWRTFNNDRAWSPLNALFCGGDWWDRFILSSHLQEEEIQHLSFSIVTFYCKHVLCFNMSFCNSTYFTSRKLHLRHHHMCIVLSRHLGDSILIIVLDKDLEAVIQFFLYESCSKVLMGHHCLTHAVLAPTSSAKKMSSWMTTMATNYLSTTLTRPSFLLVFISHQQIAPQLHMSSWWPLACQHQYWQHCRRSTDHQWSERNQPLTSSKLV